MARSGEGHTEFLGVIPQSDAPAFKQLARANCLRILLVLPDLSAQVFLGARFVIPPSPVGDERQRRPNDLDHVAKRFFAACVAPRL